MSRFKESSQLPHWQMGEIEKLLAKTLTATTPSPRHCPTAPAHHQCPNSAPEHPLGETAKPCGPVESGDGRCRRRPGPGPIPIPNPVAHSRRRPSVCPASSAWAQPRASGASWGHGPTGRDGTGRVTGRSQAQPPQPSLPGPPGLPPHPDPGGGLPPTPRDEAGGAAAHSEQWMAADDGGHKPHRALTMAALRRERTAASGPGLIPMGAAAARRSAPCRPGGPAPPGARAAGVRVPPPAGQARPSPR